MALTYSTMEELGRPAPAFSLPGADGRNRCLEDFSNAKALVVVFMCNHCPYVIAVQGRINALARAYADKGVALVGINPNDPTKYPDDSFESMKKRAREQGYVFPYLQDATQEVARAYGAVCTPDFFVYENTGSGTGPGAARFLLRYRGRLDDNWKDETAVTRRDLAAALDAILARQAPSTEQIPSMGCSIKWRSDPDYPHPRT